MTYNQRDIVLIPIPFTDLSSSKRRPVVVISNDNYNENNPDIVVAALTSNLVMKNQFCIEIDNSNLESGVLPQKSLIKCDKVYTLSKNIIVKRFNKITKETHEDVRIKLNSLLESRRSEE